MTNQDLKNTIAAEYASRFSTTKISRAQLLELKDEIQHRFSTGVSFLQSHACGRGLYDISPFLNEGVAVASQAPERTDEEIVASQRSLFKTLGRMGEGVVAGQIRSMIVSGPAGTGKTYTIEGLLESAAEEGRIRYEACRGFIRPTGLFRMLWENREKDQVILLDDADEVFKDEAALNILKAALDTTKKRVISWRTEKQFEDAQGDIIPNTFEYRGSIIFITNIDFERKMNTSNGCHYAALISRSYYIDLNMGTSRELMLRIKDVLATSDMAETIGLNQKQVKQMITFVEENYNNLRDLTLRMILKLGRIILIARDDADFRALAAATCFKSGR